MPNDNVVFIEDNTSVGKDLEMLLSGRNESSIDTMVIIDKSSKSPSFDDDEEDKGMEDFNKNKQVGKQDAQGYFSTPQLQITSSKATRPKSSTIQ